MPTHKTLSVGSRSHGTLRHEDLAEAVLDLAREAGIEYESGLIISGEGSFDALSSWLEHYNDHEDEPCDGIEAGPYFRPCPLDNEPDYVDSLLDECTDALSEYAPVYCYIGMVEGDGSDFGVWLSQDALDEAIRTAVRSSDDRLVNVEDGTIIEVNDHGNVTVWELSAGRELLAIV